MPLGGAMILSDVRGPTLAIEPTPTCVYSGFVAQAPTSDRPIKVPPFPISERMRSASVGWSIGTTS